MQIRHSKAPSIERLRSMKDYSIAQAAPDYLFIGRAEETASYKKTHPGRILHPEGRGAEWTLEKNMAFMAGAIEANNTFLIVTPLHAIAGRAKRGLTGQCASQAKLGYATAEILWLQDNGYTFERHAQSHDFTWAHPPKNKIETAVIRQYGHTGDIDDVSSKEQVERICSIAGISGPEAQKRNTMRNPNPRSTGTFWGEDRSNRPSSSGGCRYNDNDRRINRDPYNRGRDDRDRQGDLRENINKIRATYRK